MGNCNFKAEAEKETSPGIHTLKLNQTTLLLTLKFVQLLTRIISTSCMWLGEVVSVKFGKLNRESKRDTLPSKRCQKPALLAKGQSTPSWTRKNSFQKFTTRKSTIDPLAYNFVTDFLLICTTRSKIEKICTLWLTWWVVAISATILENIDDFLKNRPVSSYAN